MHKRKLPGWVIAVPVSIAMIASVAIMWLLATSDAQEAHQRHSAPTATTTPTTTSSPRAELSEEEVKTTFSNTVQALNMGTVENIRIDNVQGGVYGELSFYGCPLTIEAPISNLTSPSAVLANEVMPLTTDTDLGLRTMLNNDPAYVAKLGWQECWVTPGG